MTVPHDDRLAFADPLRDVRRAVREGAYADAIRLLDGAAPATRGTPEALLLSAMARWRIGAFVRSRTAAVQARDGFRTRGDADGEMRAENVAAAGAFALGDLAEAERGFTRALDLADELGDDLMIARCANNLGNVAYYLRRSETALSFYRLALANFERLGFTLGLAEGWLNTTLALHDAGQLEESRDAAERAVEAAERSGDARILGQALAARSETDIARGDVDFGRALAERALALARAHEHVMGEVDALRILGTIARVRGEPHEALRLVESALDIARRLADPWREAECRRELGILYRSVGRDADARTALAAAADAFGRLGADGRAADMRELAAEPTG
jgi:tetratricopeptide (TPR) repeat protein